MYDKIVTLMIGLHYFYTKSYNNKKSLQSSIKACNIKGLMPPKVTGTRWLAHLSRGIISVTRTFKAYEASLYTTNHIGCTIRCLKEKNPTFHWLWIKIYNKGNNKITELRTILTRTFKAYEASLYTLSHKNPKAERLAKILLNKHVICFMLFLKVLVYIILT
jgi:hypothetical protein